MATRSRQISKALFFLRAGRDAREFFLRSEIDIRARKGQKWRQSSPSSVLGIRSWAKRNDFQRVSDDVVFSGRNGHKQMCMNRHNHNFKQIYALRQRLTRSDVKTLAHCTTLEIDFSGAEVLITNTKLPIGWPSQWLPQLAQLDLRWPVCCHPLFFDFRAGTTPLLPPPKPFVFIAFLWFRVGTTP